jgi:hypothetical protein
MDAASIITQHSRHVLTRQPVKPSRHFPASRLDDSQRHRSYWLLLHRLRRRHSSRTSGRVMLWERPQHGWCPPHNGVQGETPWMRHTWAAELRTIAHAESLVLAHTVSVRNSSSFDTTISCCDVRGVATRSESSNEERRYSPRTCRRGTSPWLFLEASH